MIARARVAVLALLCCFAAACGPSSREQAIATTLRATDAAASGFVTYDRQHQQDIVAHAGSRAAGETELEAWRAKQATIERAFTATYRAIAAAATLEDDPSYAGMLQAALLLSTELRELGIGGK